MKTGTLWSSVIVTIAQFLEKSLLKYNYLMISLYRKEFKTTGCIIFCDQRTDFFNPSSIFVTTSFTYPHDKLTDLNIDCLKIHCMRILINISEK